MILDNLDAARANDGCSLLTRYHTSSTRVPVDWVTERDSESTTYFSNASYENALSRALLRRGFLAGSLTTRPRNSAANRLTQNAEREIARRFLVSLTVQRLSANRRRAGEFSPSRARTPLQVVGPISRRQTSKTL